MLERAYSQIYEYWNRNVCNGGYADFPYWLYEKKKVLEIGCGGGVDAVKFAKDKVFYTGIDLTEKAVDSTRQKLFEEMSINTQVLKMNAESLNFPDNHFDLVYSWGVIHHTLNPEKVINEIHRVLKPEKRFFVMVYSRPSIRYFEIMYLRKILWHARYWKYKEIRKDFPRPTRSEWISINTDEIGCPLSRVYTKDEAESLFKNFENVYSFTREGGWFRIVVGKKSTT